MKSLSLKRGVGALVVGLSAFTFNAAQGSVAQTPVALALRQQRLAPPPSVKCPHNNLTVYEGRIIAYRRSARRTFLRIRTDAETTESVTIRHGASGSPSQWFLLRAEPFRAGDWKLIERSRGRLRPGMRAHVWACSDGSNPVVDWQPPVQ